jgi:two-component system OmpR family sensor kinase
MKSFRAQMVATTVALVALVMLAVIAGTQLVLEAGEGRPRFQSALTILLATGLVGAFGVVLSGVVAWYVSRRALRPVRQMAERADEWSASDLERRFDLGAPTNELSQLGSTLDALLDRVAGVIRDEQRLTAELAHEIRTPLTAIIGSAELARMRAPGDPGLRSDLDEISGAGRRLSDVVTSLLQISQTPGASGGSTSLDEAVAVVRDLVIAPVRLRVEGSVPRIEGSLALVGRALAPLVENAGQHAVGSVVVSARADHFIEISVADDGPGVAPELREKLFDPGVSSRGSSGLGLGIARRAARSLGGDVTVEGDAFVLRLRPSR